MNEREMKTPSERVVKDRSITLIDIVDFMRNNFVALAVGIVFGGGCGIAVYSYIPSKWQADVTLQIGKIPVMQNLIYINPPVEVVEKVKSPLFLSKMLSVMYGNKAIEEPSVAALLYKDLKVSLVKGSDLVTVRVFGRNANEAYKNAGILADSVIVEHQALAAPYMAGAEKRLAEVVADIARSREVLAKVDMIERNVPSKNEANALLKIALMDAKGTEIQRLKAEQAKLEDLLSTAKLQATRVVGRSLVPDAPSSPSLILWIVGGVVFGLLLGLLWSLMTLIRHRGWKILLRS